MKNHNIDSLKSYNDYWKGLQVDLELLLNELLKHEISVSRERYLSFHSESCKIITYLNTLEEMKRREIVNKRIIIKDVILEDWFAGFKVDFYKAFPFNTDKFIELILHLNIAEFIALSYHLVHSFLNHEEIRLSGSINGPTLKGIESLMKGELKELEHF
jgi:hypothetical protein